MTSPGFFFVEQIRNLDFAHEVGVVHYDIQGLEICERKWHPIFNDKLFVYSGTLAPERLYSDIMQHGLELQDIGS